MKKRLRALLAGKRFEEIAQFAAQKKRALHTLLSLTFDQDRLIAWRAVEAMGRAADLVAENNEEFVRGHLRRLLWLLNEESGGVCWYAPQAMAEIIRRRPEKFEDFSPIVMSLLTSMADEDLEYFRPGILWAIGRIAPVAVREIDPVIGPVVASLDHPEPQVRGMAVWCLHQAGRQDLLEVRKELLLDNGSVELYVDGELQNSSVRDIYAGATSAG